MVCSRPSSETWNACFCRPFTGLPSSLTMTSTTTKLDALRMVGPEVCGAAAFDSEVGAFAGGGVVEGFCAHNPVAKTRRGPIVSSEGRSECLMRQAPPAERGRKNQSKKAFILRHSDLQLCSLRKANLVRCATAGQSKHALRADEPTGCSQTSSSADSCLRLTKRSGPYSLRFFRRREESEQGIRSCGYRTC